MKYVNITELRQHLPAYLSSVQQGSEFCVTSHGRVIAHITPPTDLRKIAIKKLDELREKAVIGDVVSPIDVQWDVEQ